MLRPEDSPTPLVPPSERAPIPIVPVHRARSRRLRVLVVVARVGAALVARRLVGRLSAAQAGVLVREAVERLGGLWIKAAQIASLRFDRLPWDFCIELMKVQDRAKGYPPEEARRIIEEDFGRPIEEIFESFVNEPLAAASIGQVHRAVLPGRRKRQVAVKVQRPDITTTFLPDLALLRSLIAIVDRFPALDHLRLGEGLWELQEVAAEELDYRREASALVRMRRILRRHGLYAPRTWKRFNTSRVLVMEFIDGVLVSDFLTTRRNDPERLRRWMAENDIDPRESAWDLYQSFLRQRFEDGYFHGDLHAGNLLLLRGGRVALIDFGATGYFYPEDRDKLRRYMMAITQRDFKKAVERLLKLFEPFPPIDLSEMRREYLRAIKTWAADAEVVGLPFELRSGMYIYSMVSKLLAAYYIPTNWAYLRNSRAEYTVLSVLQHLDPDMEIDRAISTYMRAWQRRIAVRFSRPDRAHRFGIQLARVTNRLPGLIDALDQDFAASLQRNAMDYEATATRTGDALGGLFSVLVLLSRMIGVSLLLIFFHQRIPWLGALIDALPRGIAAGIAAVPRFGVFDWVAVAFFYYFIAHRLIGDCRERLQRPEPSS